MTSGRYNACKKGHQEHGPECEPPSLRPLPKTHLVLTMEEEDSVIGLIAAKNEKPKLFFQHFFDISKADFYAMHR